ncbi:MAG: hypothetical protein WB341_00440 [Terracidiphilus sp.]
MNAAQRNPLRWVFMAAFVFACVLFWWLPSVLLAWLQLPDPIERWTIAVSTLALAFFLSGYVVPQTAGKRAFISRSTMNLCEAFSYRATLVIAIPAFVVGLRFAAYRAGLAYGEGGDIPLMFQAVLYTHMFVGYMYLGSVPDLEGRNRRRVLLVCALLLFPRLMVSLHWGRFFVGQTAVAIVFIAMARGWLRLSAVRWLQLALLAAVIVFVPALTRGDTLAGNDAFGRPKIVAFFQSGSTLLFFQEYRNLRPQCPPLLVSLTAKVIPYSALHVCTMTVGSVHNTPAVLSSVLTRQESNDFGSGTGSVYLLELYLTGGMAALLVGSALFGASCRWFVEYLGQRSLLSGVWAECLVRALFAPRGDLGYVFERVPSLLLATLAVIVLCRSVEILRKSPVLVQHT